MTYKSFNILFVFFSFLFFVPFGNAQSKQFTLLPSAKTNITFSNTIKDDKEKNILLYSNFYGGAGVGIGDFNNDGRQDIFFAGNMVDDKLYINQGNFVFKDATLKSGIVSQKGWSTGVTVADVNNDGWQDIYVSKELYDHQPELRKNKLYINQGNATFKEMATDFGIDNSERTRHAVFFDYDKDGYLDLFILNQPPNPGSYSEYFGTQLLKTKYTSRLYKNVKGEKFVDVTQRAGLVKAGFPNAVSASDFNNDGWIDLYVTNDFYAPDFLYVNNGDGTFTNQANTAFNHMSYYSMGIDVADINNNTFMDAFVLDMVAEDNFRLKSNMSGMNPKAFWNVVNNGWHYQYMFNNFHLNNGNGTFSEIAQLMEVATTDWSWANLIADFDNDGKKDIFVTNGLLRDIRNTDASKAVGDYVVETANKWVKENPNGGEISIWEILDLKKALDLLPSTPLVNYMFKNEGNYNFKKVAKDWGMEQKSFSNGASYVDLDNDGDLDIVVNNINNEAFVYQNNSKENYVRVLLKSKKNKPTLGTRITIITKQGKQFIETTNVRGIYSTSEQNIAHFGVGKIKNINEIKIDWNNGTTTVLRDIKSNKTVEVFLENGVLKSDEETEISTLFKNVTNKDIINYKHKENDFDDYKYQVLLPHKMSQFGPALAVGDVNGDKLDDVFVGAASGMVGQLFIQEKQGKFIPKYIPSFTKDMLKEDVDAIFFDADNDGDNDLFVVSGGNEFEKGNGNYEDRLYMNDGKGNFKKSNKYKDAYFTSGSVVKPCDFDNDGDIDLFVGGRLQPRAYPLPTNSKVLRNEKGKFTNVTRKIAPELFGMGMVTDAIWTDYDNDGDKDLLIVGEWMPITVFENHLGKFSKKEIADFKNTSGWWFSIAKADFDNDGDEDYVVGNLGVNYKYKTSLKNQFDVYYNDFDNNGASDIVLGYYNFNKHYPVRGFSCSSEQVPKLKKDIKKYDIFASMEIQEVYDKDKLKKSTHYTTQTFESIFIENKGQGRFKIRSLPVEAQFSNINDFLIEDSNKDGFLDIICVGNLFVSEIETTRNDAGIGSILLGDGKNNFTNLNHLKSGFFTNKDAKKIKKIKIKNHKYLLIGNNNDTLQIFKKQ